MVLSEGHMVKRFVLSMLVLSLLLSAPLGVFATGRGQIDVVYMNHAPMQPTLKQIKEVFSKYGDTISVSW
jgi:hypothetical protein